MHLLQPAKHTGGHRLHGPYSKGEHRSRTAEVSHACQTQAFRLQGPAQCQTDFVTSQHTCCLPCCLQLWDVESGKECSTLCGHTAEIVSVCFNTAGDLLVTGSFDHSSRLWDVRTGQCVHVLSGHRGEVSNSVFNHAGEAFTSAGGHCY